MISAVNEFLDDLRGGRMTEAPVVSVEQGQVQGRIATNPAGRTFYSFQGIPYAKPPLGSLRFQAPQPPEPWDGIRDATSEGNISAQVNIFSNQQYTGDENCLFLNVYTPNLDGAFLPVMIFIHGGGLKFGSGNTDLYGPDYLVEKDVVVVTLNYRCGVLGFLSLNTPEVPGNAGLKDIVQAIRWVKDNIQNFGGNSGNITIFGESAGGVAAGYLVASPLSKNLFNKAIIQSGTALSSYTVQKTPLENARTLAKLLGCESGDPEEILEFLRACSAKELVEAHQTMNPPEAFLQNAFNVVVEKDFPGVEAIITESFIDLLTSGRVAQIPIMIGACALEFEDMGKTSDDLQSFIPDELNIEKDSAESLEIVENLKELYFKGDKDIGLVQLLSDRFVKVDTNRFVQYLVQVTNKPIYYYNFDYFGALNIYGKVVQRSVNHVAHMDELGYLFKNDYQNDLEVSEQDNTMRERMVRLWTNFAKGGNPTPEESHYLKVTWLPVSKDNLYYLNIGSELTLDIKPDKEKMEFWENLYRKHFRIWEHPKTNNEAVAIKCDPPVVVASFTEADTVPSSEVIDSNGVVTETPEVTTESNEVITERTEVTTESNEVITEKTEVTTESNEVIAERTEVIESNDLLDSNEPIKRENEAPIIVSEIKNVIDEPILSVKIPTQAVQEPEIESPKYKEAKEPVSLVYTNHVNGDRKARTSNEIKMVSNSNGAPKDVIRANDPPEDDLPKNIGVNKFVNFFESLAGKK